MPRKLSTGVSTLETQLLWLGVPTWTLASLSARIVGSGVIWLEFAEFKDQNVLSAMVLISWIIIGSLLGVAKLTLKLTHLDSKYRRASLALTCSNVSTARDLTLLTQSNAYSGNTVSTKSGTSRNMLISRKPGENPSTLTRVKQENDFKRLKNLFSKHSQEQLPNQYYPQSQPRFQHPIHPRTIVDYSQIHPEFYKSRRCPFIRGS